MKLSKTILVGVASLTLSCGAPSIESKRSLGEQNQSGNSSLYGPEDGVEIAVDPLADSDAGLLDNPEIAVGLSDDFDPAICEESSLEVSCEDTETNSEDTANFSEFNLADPVPVCRVFFRGASQVGATGPVGSTIYTSKIGNTTTIHVVKPGRALPKGVSTSNVIGKIGPGGKLVRSSGLVGLCVTVIAASQSDDPLNTDDVCWTSPPDALKRADELGAEVARLKALIENRKIQIEYLVESMRKATEGKNQSNEWWEETTNKLEEARERINELNNSIEEAESERNDLIQGLPDCA